MGTGAAFFTVPTSSGVFSLRRANQADLPHVVRLLAEDQLGASRETPDDLAPYQAAFKAIDNDPAHLLIVGVLRGDIVATFQLTFLPSLSRRGAWRAQIEAVRVSSALRSQGIGQLMMQWAIECSRQRGCSLVQLTTDKSRGAAHQFYKRLGFTATHEGMKLTL
ncbi:N-acetyltransferase family protein [Pseudarthrobacter enclensis]|uniref:GNAT family N-acetyltransferase n=1 Tax=Pseudarthrobacter enclensis TaxID=993070 RepID=UPI003F4DA024